MKKLINLISEEVTKAFVSAGYDEKYGKVTLSNRPDLCEFQCNGAMAAAKEYKCAPFMISDKVAALLESDEMFESVESVKPGFLNIKMDTAFLAKYMNDMKDDEGRYGLEKAKKPLTIVVDYGGEYPKEAPFTISELEDIYPTASGKSKSDESFKEAALLATKELQGGRRGYQALLSHIMNVSVTDLKRNYENLNVHFELWKGESDAQPYVPGMVEMMKEKGFAHMSEGALVVDVKEDTDTKEIPPCIILKSDGASLYSTTDLATLVMRMKENNPDRVIYLADARQSMHFIQVFRCARKTGIVPDTTELVHIGFGTMNGKDGKPFKTRDGGVMRLEYLLKEIDDEMLNKIKENQKEKENLNIDEAEAEQTAKTVALAAVKYGDLSNQASKDYIFDIDRFTSFEGNTGPYILYTIVRIKSILSKYEAKGGDISALKDAIMPAVNEGQKNLMLSLAKFNATIESAYEESAPHKICAYIYELANAFNGFYHDTKILSEENEELKKSYISLLVLTKEILEACIDMLGFSAPDRM